MKSCRNTKIDDSSNKSNNSSPENKYSIIRVVLTMAVAANPLRKILLTKLMLASTPPNTLDLYAGTTYGPDIQYPQRSSQKAAKNLSWRDLTSAGFSSMSALAVASDEVNLSTALKPTAPEANTMRSESNKATGLAVADETMPEREVCPPARGMDNASDLAAAAVPDRDMDSSVLLKLVLELELELVPGQCLFADFWLGECSMA